MSAGQIYSEARAYRNRIRVGAAFLSCQMRRIHGQGQHAQCQGIMICTELDAIPSDFLALPWLPDMDPSCRFEPQIVGSADIKGAVELV
jgi:hypothetical protein